ncbi:MAG TPA: hypothetical protein PLT68_05495 [Actinomycetota bacterium]|nr:hypothetical protein [Actinomycetota bacterium]
MMNVCPANAAGETWEDFAEGTPLDSTMTAEFRNKTKRLAAVYRRAARELTDPEYEWPTELVLSIERLADVHYGDSAALSDAIKEDTVTLIQWAKPSRKAASRVRLRLRLPPAGTGCKKYVD